MKVVVEAISSVEKKVTVGVPADKVDRALDVEFKRIGKTAKVRGFRPGKIPRGLLRKMYRVQANSAVSESLIRDHLSEAFKEAGLEPLAVPDVDRGAIAEGTVFEFTLFCEVRPDIELKGIDGLKVERRETEPTDEAMAAELETRRMSQAELEPVEDRAADIGDTITMDYSGRLADADEPFEGGVGTDTDIELGSGTLVPGFEDQLVGSKEGDSVVVNLALPDSYPDELADKAAVFDVVVKTVRRKVVPDLDDDLAVDLGFDDLGALRASVYDSLKNAAVEEESARIREEAVNGLIFANPVEVPKSLIEQAAERLRQRLGMHLRMQGMPDEFLKMALEQQDGMIDERALELARRDLLLEALAESRSIVIDDAMLDDRIGEIAESTGDPIPKVRGMLQRGGGMDVLREEMLRDRALDWLIDKATGVLDVLGESEAATLSDTPELDKADSEGQDTSVAADAEPEAPEAEAETEESEETAS